MTSPLTTINQYLEEVRRLDRVAPTEPWEFFQGAFCCGKPEARQIMFVPKPTTSKEVVEFIEMTRTAAPRLAAALSWLTQYMGPDDPRHTDAFRHIAQILEGEESK